MPEETETFGALDGVISPDVLYDPRYGDPFGELQAGPREIEDAVMRCTRDTWNTCRWTYNSSLLTSAGLAVGVFAGCNGITALAGFAACTGGALGMHGFNIAAAQTTLNNCMNSAYGTCSRQIRGY